jgi:hypothetical protein
LPLEVLLHLGRGRRFGAGPHATSPKPAAPAHSARARCRRPAAQCPAQAAAWVTTGATRDTHMDVREGLPPSRRRIRGPQQRRRGLAVITSHPRIVAQAARACQCAPQA